MISILNELIQYLINPILLKDENKSYLYRFKVLIYLLLISFIFSFFISTITRILTLVGVLHDVSPITDSLFDD